MVPLAGSPRVRSRGSGVLCRRRRPSACRTGVVPCCPSDAFTPTIPTADLKWRALLLRGRPRLRATAGDACRRGLRGRERDRCSQSRPAPAGPRAPTPRWGSRARTSRRTWPCSRRTAWCSRNTISRRRAPSTGSRRCRGSTQPGSRTPEGNLIGIVQFDVPVDGIAARPGRRRRSRWRRALPEQELRPLASCAPRCAPACRSSPGRTDGPARRGRRRPAHGPTGSAALARLAIDLRPDDAPGAGAVAYSRSIRIPSFWWNMPAR